MHRFLPRSAVALSLLLASTAGAQSLRGSRDSVDRMYRHAVRNDLAFYRNAGEVRKATETGDLVRLSGNGDFELKGVSQPYVLPTTRTFVQRLGSQYRNRCGEKLVVTSGTRPTSVRLANGTARSVHPTGMAIDLRRPRDSRCLAWLRETLSSLEAEGVLEATEERSPPHFHVAVFPSPYTRFVGRGGSAKLASAKTPAARANSGKSSGTGGKEATSRAEKETYRVRNGDSLWTIARRSRVSVDEIKSANSLRSSRIVAGQVLIIP